MHLLVPVFISGSVIPETARPGDTEAPLGQMDHDGRQIYHEGMNMGSRDAGWVASPGRQVWKLPGEGPRIPALPMEVSAG